MIERAQPLPRNEKPQRANPPGFYEANSAVRLVSPPVELIDQRGSDRLDIGLHVFDAHLQAGAGSWADSYIGAVEARVSIFAAPEQAAWQWQWQSEQSRQRDFRAAAYEPAVICLRTAKAARLEVGGREGKIDPIKTGLSVAAIPVREDIRRDQITDPSTDCPS